MGQPVKRPASEREQLESLVARALELAMRGGADQAEAEASSGSGLSATARLGEVENLEYTRDRGISITVYKDKRRGSASTSDMTPAAVAEAVDKASLFARLTAPDEYSGLAAPEQMGKALADIELDFAWPLDARAAIDLAVRCESAALAFDERIANSEGATVSSGRGERCYGNSHGFIGSVASSSHSVSCAVLGVSGDEMQRDYHYSVARDPADLEDVEQVGLTAATRAIARLGARQIETRPAPVLFVRELARGFVGHAIGAIAGEAQYRRASFLLGALGEQVFPDFVDVLERPHLPRGMASRPFDADGVATYDRDVVKAGVLQGYVLSCYSARRLGMETTANAGGAQNLVIPGNGGGFEDLVQRMGTGLIVEELIGQGVNPVTGDYSRGAVGHWVEDGEIRYPVHEVTIAGNLRELYRRISAIGNDQDLRGGIRCGSLLVDEMMIAGT